MRSIFGPALVILGLSCVPAGAQWQTIEPGGETSCSDGSAYRFYVHPGDPEKLVVEFEGGGACWSAQTCAMGIYSRSIEIGPEEALAQGLVQGIYDRENLANPLRDWTHVYVPYCSGDVHWGLKDQTYTGTSGPYDVRHRGVANAGVAVAWAAENVATPSQVLVTGCSAGGYGSVMWAPRLIAQYPAARVAQLSDSAAGVMPAMFLGVLRESWNVEAIWPGHIPALATDQLDPSNSSLTQLYDGLAAYYPLATFSQFNRAGDSVQLFFTALAEESIVLPEEWAARMRASIDSLETSSPNFHSYTALGSDHCIINQPTFYTTEVNGIRFSDWVARLVAAGDPGSVTP